MSTSSGSPFTPQKSIVTFHYIFDWNSLTKVKSKMDTPSYDVIRSNFVDNYYDLPNNPQFKLFGNKLLDKVEDEEKNNIINTNALVVEFGNRTEMPRTVDGLSFCTINANVTDEKTGETEEKKTEKHFDNEFLFLESIVNDRNIKNVYFLMIDENEFSFRLDKSLQKKYYKKSPNSYLNNSINRLINSKSDYRKGRSYVHPPILKTKFGRDNKERLFIRYQNNVFETITATEKKKRQDIFWFLCYLIQELHKQFNLYEKPLKAIVDFDVNTARFGIDYKIDYMPSSRIEYFNKDENFVANSDKNFVYVVKGKQYKVISVLLNDPLTLFCNEIGREDSKVNMVLTKQFGGDTNIIYHATITENSDVKPISGILHKERKNRSDSEVNTEGTLSTKNISTLSLNSDLFYYALDLVFSENHLIQFMKSTNASDILSQISKDSVQDFIVYVLSRKSAFVQFYKYCKFKLKLNRTADKKTIITQTTQLLLRPGIPFSLTPSDTDKERTLDDVMYSVEKIISDKNKVDIDTGKIDIVIQLAYKDKKKPIGVGSNCKDSKENLMNVLRDSIKDTMMSLVRGVKGGTKKYKKRKRKTIKKKRRLS